MIQPAVPSSLPARFTDKVFVFGDCWLWVGAKQGKGYASFGWGGRRPNGNSRTVLAHRFAYEVLVGPIPAGLTLDHLCRNHACVNPDHLEPVTNKVNVLRGEGLTARYASATRCVNGHPFDAANTGSHNGKRYCRACKAERARQYYHRSKGAAAAAA